jgi:hypothetical protein
MVTYEDVQHDSGTALQKKLASCCTMRGHILMSLTLVVDGVNV